MRKLFLFTVFFTCISSPAAAASILTSGQNLTDGDTLQSVAGAYVLGFFTPANSSNRYVGIWYSNVTARTVVWVANRQSPVTAESTGVLALSSTGSLVLLTNQSSAALWSSTTAAAAGSYVAQLLDSGNLVVRQRDNNIPGEYIWQSFDYPTDTILPDMKFGPNLKSGLTRSIISWASPSDPSPGNYTLAIDPRGVPQLVIKSGSTWVWRGGPWNGAGFVGAASEANYDSVTYTSTYQANNDEIYYSFGTIEGVVTRVVIGYDGMDRRLIWLDPPGSWSVLWSGPTDACDRFSVCGAYGVCDATKFPSICSCLPGFESTSGGCVRTNALNCVGSEDVFADVNRVKLPDTSAAILETDLDLVRCRERCLMNCSCTAYASGNVTAGGSRCIMWSTELTDIKLFANGGQDLFVRLAAAHAGKKNKSWIFGVVAAAAILLIITFLICFIKMRRLRHLGTGSLFYEQPLSRWSDGLTNRLEVSKETNPDFLMFQFSQIVKATENFSFTNKLGEGGFGPVFKGKILDGQVVAVKRLSRQSGQGVEEFKNEISLIAKLQHRNLVRLLGCCIEGEEKMLVYEYMSNKSLDLFLFNPIQKAKLDWRRRFQIIDGIAQGLLYLHKHSRLTIIHRDLKASNILLDDDMKPKISDFGMARIFSSNEAEANTTNKVVGTYGYISPEYALKGHFSTKSDVFSFGVIMLEIISGKRNSGFHQQGTSLNLMAHAWKLWNEGNWKELVEDSLGGMYPLEEVSRCVHVALLCVQERAADRPSMSDLITMLNSDNAPLFHPNQPAFFLVEITTKANDSSISMHRSHSLNEMTMTAIDGR